MYGKKDSGRVPPPRSKLVDAIKKQISTLEAFKDNLEHEVRSLEKQLKTATQLAFNHNDNTNVLTQCKLFGYFLTNCKTTDLDDGTKQYTACCEDKRHPFRISVTTKGDDVTALHVALSNTSPLNEIQIILHNLSEDNCPYLVLSTIQQFIHLHNFRCRIIQEKLQNPVGERCGFQVYSPDFAQGKQNRHYLVSVKHGAIEIAWTLAWDQVSHSLTHEFNILKVPLNQNLKRLTDDLLSQTFSTQNAGCLWDWWTEFCKAIVKEVN